MVDSIFSGKNGFKPGMIARLKVTPQAKATLSAGLTSPEKQLADRLDISDAVKNRLTEARKLDGYLRIFTSALKIMNSFFSTGYKPVRSTVEIEYVEMKKSGIDKKV